MWQEDLAAELKAADASRRKEIIKTYIEKSGLSEQHLYRIAKKHGFTSGRKTRSDKGVLKTELTDRQINFVGAILYETRRENKGPIMPVERAIQIAEDNGYIEPDQVTTATMTRLLRERQKSKRHMKAPPPYTPMRSRHPNHVHVFDASVCIQYYLKDGKLGIMDERDFYKNKLDNIAKIKERLLRYVIVDHFSGWFWFQYFATSGETADNLWRFLKSAWEKKADDRLPFHGVPFHLLMDTGAANKSKAIVNFLGNLGVNIPKGKPYNPRRQGSAESAHNIIEGWFESGLRLQHATSAEEVSAWAVDFMIRHHATRIHTRHGMTRTACWQLIRAGEQLRELPEDEVLQDCYARPEEECTVRNYTISFQGKEYNLKHVEGLFHNAKVKVIKRPLKYPAIDVAWQDKIYEVNPLEKLPAHLGGFRADAAVIGESYRAQHETETQKAVKGFDNMAFGEERKKDSIPFEGLRVFGNQAEKINVAFIGKTGTPVEVDRGIAVRMLSTVEFLRKLKDEIGVVSPALNQQIRERYGSGIETKEAEEVIGAIQDGTWLKSEKEAVAQSTG